MTPYNTIISVSRRPLGSSTVASNVLDHGAGAVNIDATRVGYVSDADKEGAFPGGEITSRKVVGGGLGCGYKDHSRGSFETTRPDGRWPANLILGHKPECVRLGSKVVESTSGIMADHHRRNVPMGVNGIYGKGDFKGAKPTCYVNPDGTEVVESWECAEGCPVAELDGQSGVRLSSGGGSSQKLGANLGRNGIYGDITGSEDLPSKVGFGDTGGASRYFKQVGDFDMSTDVPNDLLQYLHTLITPTHVGGETLIALDIGAVDWASIPDGKYHGVIARGEPTKEQVEHMWRVVKPGAHVLLIAPDSCPTGHRGACALEDRGFEIRDAILWVREAGKLHYVPKANTRERNEGCEALAVKRKGPPVYELTEDAAADDEMVGSIMEALQAAGVADDVVETLVESGLPKDLVPAEFKRQFKKRVGGGKYGNNHPCLPPGEMALTIRGYRPINEIQIGDLVYASDGHFHAVEHVSHHPFTEGVVYEIAVTGIGMRTRATGNHPFLIWRPNRDKKGNLTKGCVQWIEAEDIQKGDYTMTPLLSEGGAPMGALPALCSETGFWFLFGLFLAEGCFQMAGHGDNYYAQFALHEGETDLVAKVREFVEPRGKSVAVHPASEHGIRVFAFDPELAKVFFLLGGEYASEKCLHAMVWNASLEDHHALLEGYLAGDGCRVRRHRQAKTVSADLAAQLSILASRLGYRVNHHTYAGSLPTILGRRVRSSKPEHQIALYDVNSSEGRTRKPSRPTTIKHEGVEYVLRHVKSVTEVPYEGAVWNLSVEGSPTFQTAVGMSHNTCKPIEIMKRLLLDVPEGSVVMDPFLGSGTTGRACIETGHDFIGIEREPDYIEIADARVRYGAGAKTGWVGVEIVSEAPVATGEAVDEGGIFDLFE